MNLKNYTTLFLAILVTAVVVYFIVSIMKLSANGVSREGFGQPERFGQGKHERFGQGKHEGFGQPEGFGGPAKGAGIPDCLRDSQEASDIYQQFALRENTSEEGEGADDLRELALILSKLCCLKKDLVNPSGIVEATRYQPYSTAHDLEPVAETTARCLAKTIPVRDLDLTFDKWSIRGKELIRKLCTSFILTDIEVKKVDNTYKALIDDVYDIAKGRCLKGEVSIAGTRGPREVNPYTPPELEELREYKGYY
uniref:Uncharacterized protein n=1 Tax=viral metagenome TaxID=1070528 RepID=A0A6C0D7E7_9ZZZZ